MIKLTDLVAPQFYSLHNIVKNNGYVHYWLSGGRGSTKSSFISVEIVNNMMKDGANGIYSNCVVYRRVKDTLAESVKDQIKWAIDKLGVNDFWDVPESKLTITYKPTGQQIRFKGADNELKSKSIKFSKGWCKYVWFEEVAEFESHKKIRTILQSLMRGGDSYVVFYSYNPPESQKNWVNAYVQEPRNDTLHHHSDYRTVPRNWLGEQFIVEAEHLKKIKPQQYEHEYLGIVTGTGREVFPNVTLREITDEEISNFDRIHHGMDFGYGGDPLAYVKLHYDKTRRRLYIFGEVYGLRLSNREIKQKVSKFNPLNKEIICDSAEPRTINELNQSGMRCRGAKKGADSVEHGIKFLQDLEEIIIDPIRCPNTSREFNNYELDIDKEGNLKGGYPDRDNHSIDAVRYALNDEIIRTRARASKNRNRYT